MKHLSFGQLLGYTASGLQAGILLVQRLLAKTIVFQCSENGLGLFE